MPAQPHPTSQSHPVERPRHSDALDRLIDAGLQIVDEVVAASKASAPPETKAQIVTAAATAYDRLNRAIRRAILLSQHLHDPAIRAAQQRTAARKRILREVEDRIQREDRPHERECLHAELLDRLDSLDLDEEIANRPVEEIITDIIRDLRIGARIAGVRPWKRRTPEDVALLCARAANAPGAPRPPQPVPPPDPASSDLPPETAEELERFFHDVIAPQLE